MLSDYSQSLPRMTASLYGPVQHKRHDNGMLAESGLLQQLTQHSNSPGGQPFCIYGYTAYSLRVHLQGPLKGTRLTDDEKDYNKLISKVCVSVE